jgi:hypothetical protein
LRHKVPTWASGGPAGGRLLVVCLGDGAYCPCASRHAANDSKLRWVFQIRLSCPRGESYATSQSEARNFFLAQQRFLLNPPLGATFVVNSEPHTGARPSVRVCGGLIMLVCSAIGGRIVARCFLLWALGRTLRLRFDLALKTGQDSTQVNCKILCVFESAGILFIS